MKNPLFGSNNQFGSNFASDFKSGDEDFTVD